MEPHRAGADADRTQSDLAHREAARDSAASEANECETPAELLKPRPLSWRRPGEALAVLMILAYQKLLSPLLGANCRFHPTCSQYTRLAIQKYGVVRGVWRGMKRIARCHPWNPGGYDPP